MQLAVISVGGANFYSIEMALKRLGINYQLTSDPTTAAAADAIILPGVGAAAYAMAELERYNLVEFIRNYQRPLLGICLGMQLLYEQSAEGEVACLGLVPGRVRKFVASSGLPVPHMGWNSLQLHAQSPLLAGIQAAEDVYFVHSFYAPISQATLASCDYGVPFSAMVNHNNFYGMQFHPEKSGAVGERLLANFCEVVHANLSGN